MKCIQYLDSKKVHRVHDEVAHRAVNNALAIYVPKHVWKKGVRDAK